jgi:drug/metabolite transporter (DMT)-like permease
LWLAGLGADATGVACQTIALRIGGIVLVQPLLATAVVEGLALRALLARERPARREQVLAVVLLLAIGGFVIPLQLGRVVTRPDTDRAPALMFVLLAVVVVAGALAVARVVSSGDAAASTLGAASGLLYAGSAALLTLVAVQWTRVGLAGVLSRDEVYALVVAGVGSQVLSQLSFGSGRLAASSPVSTAVDMLTSVALGVAVFDHPLPHGVVRLTAAVVSLAGACWVVVALGRQSTPPAPRP